MTFWICRLTSLAILSAALLSALPANAQVKTLPWGIYYLTDVSRSSEPNDPKGWAVWSNSHLKGVCARQTWEQLEPSEGVFNWTYLEAVDKEAAAHTKYYEITIQSGADEVHQNWPNWLLTDNVPTITLHDNAGFPVVVPIPWDPGFQAKWRALIVALGSHFDGKYYCHCIQMTGPGRGGELFFAENPIDYNYLVSRFGQNWPSMWQQAAQTIAGFYANSFPSTPFQYANGRPSPKTVDPNNTTMGQVVDNLNTAYNAGNVFRFGTRDSGYYYNGKPIQWGFYFQGYQQNGSVGNQAGPEALQLAGSPYNALWFEVTPGDCTDSANYKDFDLFNTKTRDPKQLQ